VDADSQLLEALPVDLQIVHLEANMIDAGDAVIRRSPSLPLRFEQGQVGMPIARMYGPDGSDLTSGHALPALFESEEGAVELEAGVDVLNGDIGVFKSHGDLLLAFRWMRPV